MSTFIEAHVFFYRKGLSSSGFPNQGKPLENQWFSRFLDSGDAQGRSGRSGRSLGVGDMRSHDLTGRPSIVSRLCHGFPGTRCGKSPALPGTCSRIGFEDFQFPEFFSAKLWIPEFPIRCIHPEVPRGQFFSDPPVFILQGNKREVLKWFSDRLFP